MSNKQDKDEKMQRFIYKSLPYLLALSIISPIIFSWVDRLGWFNFNEATSHVGGTIGGISAPFVSLLAAALVYLSFKEQIKANENVIKIYSHRIKFNGVDNLYKLLENYFEGFHHKQDGEQTQLSGQAALLFFIEEFNEFANKNRIYGQGHIMETRQQNECLKYLQNRFIQLKYLYKILKTTKIILDRIDILDDQNNESKQMKKFYFENMNVLVSVNDLVELNGAINNIIILLEGNKFLDDKYNKPSYSMICIINKIILEIANLHMKIREALRIDPATL